MATKKYPNPKLFRFKDNIDWKRQAENFKEVAGICKELLDETDWKEAGKKHIAGWKNFGSRVADETKTFAAMSNKERVDLLVNGEKHLGKLYRAGSMAFTRREWRGAKDTAVDFFYWAQMWGMFLTTFSKDLIPSLNGVLNYRWMISYFCSHSFMDKNCLGLRGSNLRMNHIMLYQVYRYVAENIVFLNKADRRGGNCEELSKIMILMDEMTMAQLMAGFPELNGMAYQLIPVFLLSEIDQLACIPYIDAVESYGLPADACPVPASECGAAVIDALPQCGKCFISSSMPCDGSVMASSFQDRRFRMPTFHLTFPVRYEDEETLQCGVEEIKHCIKFIEEQTGAKWNWDAYFTAMKRFNTETGFELEKWDINKTDHPQILGPNYELFRKWNYEMDGGLDPRVHKSMKKVNKIMLRAYERGEEPWPGKMRHRAIVWSVPAHYYCNFSNWLANCWGINVLVEMEGLNFTKPLETEDPQGALEDMARLYERMVMRRHTNGGYDHVLTELWRQVEAWRPEIVIMYQHVSCKTMSTLAGLFDEEARARGIHMIWVEHDLMDPRTVSRRSMRSKVNDYMTAVMREEPLDPSLLEFEDDATW